MRQKASQIRIKEICSYQCSPFQVGTGLRRVGQADLAQGRVGEVGIREVHVGQVGTGQVRVGQVTPSAERHNPGRTRRLKQDREELRRPVVHRPGGFPLWLLH